jgi:hypothetical protein
LYLRHPVMVDMTDEAYGRDKLTFKREDKLLTKVVKTGKWIWVWLK